MEGLTTQSGIPRCARNDGIGALRASSGNDAQIGVKAKRMLRSEGQRVTWEISVFHQVAQHEKQEWFVRRGITSGAVDAQLGEFSEPIIGAIHDYAR